MRESKASGKVEEGLFGWLSVVWKGTGGFIRMPWIG